MSTLGTRLKILRDTQSLETFSNILGIHRVTLSRFEKDERIPDADFLKTVVEQAGVCSEWLLLGTGSMFKEECPTCRTNFDAEISQPIEIKNAEVLKQSDVSDISAVQRDLMDSFRANASLQRELTDTIRENGDLRVELERREWRIRELEREVEALRKAMKPAAVPGMDRQGVA